MNNKRNLWIFISIVILAAALVSGFILMQPSAEDILVQTIETTKTINDGHAVVAINIDSLERDSSAKVEIWALREEGGTEDEHHMGAFRVEVLETNYEKAQGAVIVSDGKTLWAYSPNENKVFVGTPEEAQVMMAENETIAGRFSDLHKEYNSKHGEEDGHDDGHIEHPESAEEAVAKMLEYFNIRKSGTQNVAGENSTQLTLEPISEKMPDEYIAIGGLLDLWIGQDNNLPLAVSYTGGSMGEFNASVLEYEFNAGIDNSRFTFEMPAGVEIVTFADLEPNALTLEQAGETAEFDLLTLAETPEGATLVDILEVRGAIVQRYTLPEGGSFTIAQGKSTENTGEIHTPHAESQSVELRGTTGNLFVSEDGGQVLLTWVEGDLAYSVAGDLTPEAALLVAESLQ